MNQEIGQEWVRRLRSGEYPQGQNFLNSERGYCCLGVLCEMAVDAGIVQRRQAPEDEHPGMAVFQYGGEKDEFGYPSWHAQFLPAAVRNWAGLPEVSPSYDSGRVDEEGEPLRVTLALRNDQGIPFDMIAYLIEEHFIKDPVPA